MKTRKITRMLAIVFAMFLALSINVNAASLGGKTNVDVGETFTLTFNFETNIGAYDSINVSYDNTMYEYVSGDSLNESVWWDQSDASNGISTKTYTFRALKAGSSRITVVAKGVTSANASMDFLGTLTAEKMVTSSAPVQEPVQPTPQPQPQQTKPAQNNNTVTLNSNNYLKYIQLSEEGINPFFTKNVTEYSLTVNESVESIDVIARAEDSNAKVNITGNTGLVNGDNIISIQVTAQNGSVRTYKITVTKTNDAEKSNAYLENLIIENYTLDTEFQSEVLEYNIGKVPNGEEVLNVFAVAKDELANIEIIGADKLQKNGKVVIKVTAQDGQTIREYVINYELVDPTEDEAFKLEMKDYLKDIQTSKTTKEKMIAYARYIFAAMKKNYLLIVMYILILVEFVQIVRLRKKLNRKAEDEDNDDGPDDNGPEDKEVLKVELPKEERETIPQVESLEVPKVEPPQITPLHEEKVIESLPVSRHGSLQTRADGIKLVDLDKNDGPQDELTFNIFENLNEEDIKRMLGDEIELDKD